MTTLDKLFMRTGIALVFLGIAAGIGFLAVMFLTAAVFLALVESMGMPMAALATGGVLIAFAVILLLAVKLLVSSSQRPKRAPLRQDGQIAAAELGELIGEEAAAWARLHPGAVTFAALAAGFVVGSSPKLRTGLMRLFK